MRNFNFFLDVTGDIGGISEYQSSYPNPFVNFNRSSKIKYPENLKLSGDFNLLPEYQASYHPFNEMNINDDSTHKKPSKKYFQQYCNLKLEGEQHLDGEYKSQFKCYPQMEKSYSIPQISHIKFNGDFHDVPEYQDQFRFYDKATKEKLIKKQSHLSIIGKNQTVPEYRERYQGYNQSEIQRTYPIIKNDTLDMRGEFSKDLPEYYESFKDPNVRIIPERMKCRKPYLTISGTTDYHPEYKTHYLDFPRSRPITKKPQTSIRFIPASAAHDKIYPEKPQSTSTIKHNIHDPETQDISTLCQPPEVRKAQMELLKRDRTIDKRRQIFDTMNRNLPKHLDNDTLTTTTPVQTATDTEHEGSSSNDEKLRRRRPSSPMFKLLVENVDDMGGTFRRKSPKYGRRAINLTEPLPPESQNQRASHSMRNETRVIEGNPDYVRETEGCYSSKQKLCETQFLNMEPSFVVLDEPQPIQSNRWMKSHH